MKKKIILWITILLIAFRINAQENHLILMHPTEYNLDLFTYLVNNDIVSIDNLTITGVYHTKETYDYSQSIKFIEENSYSYINLKKVSKEITPENLYQENNCSALFQELFKNSNGILFFGGPDLPPATYNEQMHLLTKVTDPYRHYFESSFLFHLLGGSQNVSHKALLEQNPDYTVYGICLGMQTMNVATGGTMHQDIPTEIYGLNYIEDILNLENNEQHRNYNNNLFIDSTLFSGNLHKIRITDYSSLTGDYNGNPHPLVYSNHHQAIESLGQNLVVIATSMDHKIIEAVKHEKYSNILGIQFHPEGKYLHNPEIKYHKNPNDELKSGKEILLGNNSYEFHLKFWKLFSKRINSDKTNTTKTL